MNGGGDAQWRRVMAFLPVNNAHEISAARAIIDALKEIHDGFTASRFDDSPFEGHYRRSDGSWDWDRITLVFIDVPFADDRLDQLIRALRLFVSERYTDAGSPQEAIWVTATLLVNDPLDVQ